MNSILRVRYAFVLCGWIALAGTANAVVSDALTASQPIGASSPDKAKAEHAANKASNSKPLASAPEVAILAPQAASSQQGTNATQAPSNAASAQESGLVAHWRAKFSDDPIVAFTVFLAISTILLWWETRGLRLAAKGQAEDTKDALRIAEKAANAAKASADTARLTLDSMKDTAQKQLRAYIDVVDVSAAWLADHDDITIKKVRVHVNFKNTGQTPAHRVAGSISTKSVSPIGATFDDAQDIGSFGGQGPGGIHHFEHIEQVVNMQGVVKSWKLGAECLFVSGQINYFDAFDTPQSTEFRFFMPPEGVAASRIKGLDGSDFDVGKFQACRDGNRST